MRVWPGELPSPNYTVAETLEQTLYAKYSSPTNRRYAAIEFDPPTEQRKSATFSGSATRGSVLRFRPFSNVEIRVRIAAVRNYS